MDVDRYLERIGYEGDPAADERTLAALQRAHALRVPFDALDCYLGNPVTVEPDDAYRKVVDRLRGGYCYELNGLFGAILAELGFDVALLAARPETPVGLAEPFAHLTLLVELERRLLVDVGFGVFSMAPLDLDERGEQPIDGHVFQIAEVDDSDGAGELLVRELRPDEQGYRLSLEPRERDEFAERCRRYSTDPDSPFVRRASLQRAHEDGWTKLTRKELQIRRTSETLEETIRDEEHWRAEVRARFGFEIEGADVLPVDGGPKHG
jgi:N-hydroxyarylamine O-acetyltransferase